MIYPHHKISYIFEILFITLYPKKIYTIFLEYLMNEQLIQQIHYYCKRLGATANLVFIKNDCTNLELLLAELKELDRICIQEITK